MELSAVLAAHQRLRRRDEFAAALRSGRRVGRGSVVVHLSLPPTPVGDLPARAGFVVPRAVGGAVVRNLVRRRLRHLVRDRLGALPPGAVLVVRAQSEAGGTPYPRLVEDLDAALAAAQAPREVRR